MIIIAHRVNSIQRLKNLPPGLGVEIDIRYDNRNKRIYLNHDPGEGDDLEEYLKACGRRFVVFNIKESSTEQACIDLASRHGIEDYFLLDVEFPYFYHASREAGFKKLAVRYSEAEPIEFAMAQKGLAEWVWIDTNTCLPLDQTSAKLLQENFKTCLVSPDRWSRPQDIPTYREQMELLNFKPEAVMVDLEFAELWK